MLRGQAKFDALALMGLTIDLHGAKTITAKAAFIDTKTGVTHATFVNTTATLWSKDTLEALTALQQCVERDLAKQHFQQDTIDDPSPVEEAEEEPVGFNKVFDEEGVRQL